LSIPHDELTLLQAQLEGLESIFFELLPFGIALKRQQVQDYYNKRFSAATQAQASVARSELKRNFNTRANQVRNLVDSAESLGNVENKFNLITAAACLPTEREQRLPSNVLKFCQNLLYDNIVDPALLDILLVKTNLNSAQARLLLTCVMFSGTRHVKHGESTMAIRDLLASIVSMIRTKDILPRNDPFFNEALYFIEGMEDDT
jgi:hypothetical protein